MSCVAIVFLTWILLTVGILVSLGLLSISVALIIIAVVALLAFLFFALPKIYPWLVRMGRWSSQLRNIAFLFVVLIGTFLLWQFLNQAGSGIAPILLWAVLIPVGLLAALLLILAIVVWLVRLFRYSWPPLRNVFWDIHFRIVALGWRIVIGIPLGFIWFFYRPPLRWLVAMVLFYFRGVAAGVAWLLYNQPLRELIRVGLFFARLAARFVAWTLYNPPILWLVDAGIFSLRLAARFASGIIYAVWSWWPLGGVRDKLRKGLTVESQSYQDYHHPHNHSSPAA